MNFALLIGGTAAAAVDPLAAIAAALAGYFAVGRRSLLIGYLVALSAVLIVRLPTIVKVAERLDKADPELLWHSFRIGLAMALIAGVVLLLRRWVGGRWWA